MRNAPVHAPAHPHTPTFEFIVSQNTMIAITVLLKYQLLLSKGSKYNFKYFLKKTKKTKKKKEDMQLATFHKIK